MDQEKCDAIERFLSDSFVGAKIQQADVYGDRGFKIFDEADICILKVGREFIGDNSKESICKLLQEWQVIAYLKENQSFGVLVTQKGPTRYDLK
ncbi:MAG: hypothetical protein WD558_07825 [Pseudomonadales bacterium]